MSGKTRARRLPAELIFAITSDGGVQDTDNHSSLRARLCAELIRDTCTNGLTKAQKCYIILYYRDGLTMQQIAHKLGVNKSTVSRTVAAARRKIEKCAEHLAALR